MVCLQILNLFLLILYFLEAVPKIASLQVNCWAELIILTFNRLKGLLDMLKLLHHTVLSFYSIVRFCPLEPLSVRVYIWVQEVNSMGLVGIKELGKLIVAS